MFVTGFSIPDANLLAGPVADRIRAEIPERAFREVGRVISDSDDPGFVVDHVALTEDFSFVAIAKDKKTLVDGMTASCASVDVQRSRTPRHFWLIHGRYGSINSNIVIGKINKLWATVKGHNIVSRGDLRTRAERDLLKERGYFALIMPHRINGLNMQGFRYNDVGVMAAVPFAVLARRIS